MRLLIPIVFLRDARLVILIFLLPNLLVPMIYTSQSRSGVQRGRFEKEKKIKIPKENSIKGKREKLGVLEYYKCV